MRRAIQNMLILLGALIISSVFTWKYCTRVTTFHGDAFGYYLYLPSAFIYHDIPSAHKIHDSSFTGNVKTTFDLISTMSNERGHYLNQYTYGVALMEAPFFFVAHAYEKITGKQAMGYSGTYNIMLKCSALFYVFAGLILVFLLLCRYFSSTLSLLGVVSILLCTNLFWFAIFQAGMAHEPLFFLYALLMLLTVRLHDRPRVSLFIAIGFVGGLITLIRPTDILCLLIPLLYDVYDRNGIRRKIALIMSHRKAVGWASVAFVMVMIPQLLYWKAVTGSYICYSYGSQSFDFAHPKIIEGLFYFSNGWLPYAPIMVCSLIGMIFYRSLIKWEWCIGVMLLAYIYVIYSWYCYNYINGLGSRPMIHLYPLLALPLTAFFKFVADRNLLFRATIISVSLFLISVNLCFSVQKLEGVLDTAESNFAFNSQMLYRTKLTDDDLIVKDVGEWQPRAEEVSRLRILQCEQYDDSLSGHYVPGPDGSKYVYYMNGEDYLVIMVVPYNTELFKDGKWLRCSGRFMCPNNVDYFRHLLVMNINDSRRMYWECKIENNIQAEHGHSSEPISLTRCVANKWGTVSYFVPVPSGLKDGDFVKVAIWVTDKTEMYMDDICLELYK